MKEVVSTMAAAIGDDKMFRVESDVKAMSVCGQNMWMAHHDGDVTIRKTRTTEVVKNFLPEVGRVWSMVVVPNPTQPSEESVWLGLSNGNIDAYHGQTMEFMRRLSRHTGGIYTMAEFGGVVFSGSNDFTVCMWHAEKFRFVKQLSGHSSYVRCLYAEGTIVISGSDDHLIKVWEVPSGRVLHTHHFHEAGVSSLCRVGMHLWSGDDLGRLCIWTVATNELIQRMDKNHSGRITAIKKVGSRVYIGSADRKVSIWDAYNRRHLRSLEDHTGWVTTIACPAELSRYFVWTSGADGVVRCWHHDEYRIMNGDGERFDDMRWYYTQHTPQQDLTNSLLEQLHQLETQLLYWQKEAEGRRMDVCVANTESQKRSEKVVQLENDSVMWRKRAEEAEQQLAARNEVISNKETELKILSEKNILLTKEFGTIKAECETLRSQQQEALRRAEQAVADKASAETLVEKLRDIRTAECKGLAPVIITSQALEGTAVLALHKDVLTLLQLNESLRDELERYKGALGVRTNTPYPILAFHADKLPSVSTTGLPTEIPKPIAEAAKPMPSPPPPTSLPIGGAVAPKPLVPAPPSTPSSMAGTATAAAPASTAVNKEQGTSVATSTIPAVVTSVPLIALGACDVLRGGAAWTNPNIGSYVQDRYYRQVVPLDNTPRAISPRQAVSPRGQTSSVRPATARAFGSSTARRHF